MMLRSLALSLRRSIGRSAGVHLCSGRFVGGLRVPATGTVGSLAARGREYATSSSQEPSSSPEKPKKSDESRWMKKPDPQAAPEASTGTKANVTDGKFYFDADVENLNPEQQKQKEEIIRELTKRLSGPLADENGNVPTGDDRPIAIEVDGPSHFYANSTKYTAYTKLKHRLLTRMGYKVLHVPYFEWRRLRGAKEREDYMREKLKEEPTEWIDPEDEAFYNKRMEALKRQTEGVISTIKEAVRDAGAKQ